MVASGSAVSRFCRLIVLGKECSCRRAVGEGGKVLKGILGECRCREVNRGSKRIVEGVLSESRIANASLDPCDAVVKSGMVVTVSRIKPLRSQSS